jgi:hypothetical protein
LTALLEKAGSRTLTLPDGKKIAGKRWLAGALWELVTTMHVTLPDGRTITPEADAWFDVVKFIYAQIDGPPKQGIEMTGKDGAALVPKGSVFDYAGFAAAFAACLGTAGIGDASPDGVGESVDTTDADAEAGNIPGAANS